MSCLVSEIGRDELSSVGCVVAYQAEVYCLLFPSMAYEAGSLFA